MDHVLARSDEWVLIEWRDADTLRFCYYDLIGFFAGEDLPDAEGLNQYAKEMLAAQRDLE